jgi:hypothetical protein
MKRRLFALIALFALVAAPAFAADQYNPYVGPTNNDWTITVLDTDIGTSWEVVSADTGFTPMATDTTVLVAWAAQSKLDSLRTGNDGVGDVTGVFTMGSTADQSINANFFQDRGTGTTSYVTAVFGTAASPRYNAYLTRQQDTDLAMGASWTIAAFAGGWSAGNPGVGTVQTVFSAFGSAGSKQEVRVDFMPGGYITGYVTDDGGSTADSLVYPYDVYNSAYHFITFSCASSTLRLRVDNATAQTKALDKALNPLNQLDTLTVLAASAGTNDFRGRVDELWIFDDRTAVNAEMEGYLWDRFLSASGSTPDSAAVRLSGLLDADTTYIENHKVIVPLASAGASSADWTAFEAAWLDTEEVKPLLVFTGGASPRSALLDSIPGGELHYPVAQRYFGKYDRPFLGGVSAALTGDTDTLHVELRVYPDWADGRDNTDGFYVVWRDRLTNAAPRAEARLNVDLPKSSLLQAWSKGNTGAPNINGAMRITIDGKRHEKKGWFR